VTRSLAISLKIPDNAAFTALVALRRLGVDVARVERSEIWEFQSDDSVERLTARVESDESIFNPNLHRLAVLDRAAPRPGEVWIIPRVEPRVILSPSKDAGPKAVAWRLFDKSGKPAERDVIASAVERLLCNPAIERAVTADASDRDNPVVRQ